MSDKPIKPDEYFIQRWVERKVNEKGDSYYSYKPLSGCDVQQLAEMAHRLLLCEIYTLEDLLNSNIGEILYMYRIGPRRLDALISEVRALGFELDV